MGTLGVQEKYRHGGIATRLLDEVKGYLTKVSVSSIYLHALASNHKAIKFYMKNKFVCEKRVTGFYTLNSSEVQDALLFCFSPTKPLAQASDQCSLLPFSLLKRKLSWF